MFDCAMCLFGFGFTCGWVGLGCFYLFWLHCFCRRLLGVLRVLAGVTGGFGGCNFLDWMSCSFAGLCFEFSFRVSCFC